MEQLDLLERANRDAVKAVLPQFDSDEQTIVSTLWALNGGRTRSVSEAARLFAMSESQVEALIAQVEACCTARVARLALDEHPLRQLLPLSFWLRIADAANTLGVGFRPIAESRVGLNGWELLRHRQAAQSFRVRLSRVNAAERQLLAALGDVEVQRALLAFWRELEAFGTETRPVREGRAAATARATATFPNRIEKVASVDPPTGGAVQETRIWEFFVERADPDDATGFRPNGSPMTAIEQDAPDLAYSRARMMIPPAGWAQIEDAVGQIGPWLAKIAELRVGKGCPSALNRAEAARACGVTKGSVAWADGAVRRRIADPDLVRALDAFWDALERLHQPSTAPGPVADDAAPAEAADVPSDPAKAQPTEDAKAMVPEDMGWSIDVRGDDVEASARAASPLADEFAPDGSRTSARVEEDAGHQLATSRLVSKFREVASRVWRNAGR